VGKGDKITAREEGNGPLSDRAKIAALLHCQLNDARLRHLAASEHFNDLIAGVPTGTPEPDASLQIQQSAASARAALHHYMKALERSADFMVRGIVPEDLQPPK
jgi:hypothetical protein